MTSQEEKLLREQLEDAQHKLNILMDGMPGGVIIYDAITNRIKEVSKSLLDMFGCSEKDFREHYYNCFDLIIYKKERSRTKELIEQQLEFLSTAEITFRARDLMGEKKFLDYKGKLVTERDGSRMVYAILSDVSDMMLVQQELQRTNETLYVETQRFKLLQEAVDDIPFDLNLLNDTLEIADKSQPGGRALFESCLAEEAIRRMVSEDTYEHLETILKAAMEEPKKGTVECKIRLNEEQPYLWYRLYFISFQDKSGRMSRIVGSAKDINEEKLRQESLNEKLSIDPMTGILNKTSMQNAIREYMVLSKPTDRHALFMIDTDNFKAINDNLGHMFGDDVIRFVANTVKETFRESDFVGRVGGDEFMVFMKNATYEVAKARADALNVAMRRTFEKDGIEVAISCSIGVAFYSKDGADFETLYQNADACLYEAKRGGKNRNVFTEE